MTLPVGGREREEEEGRDRKEGERERERQKGSRKMEPLSDKAKGEISERVRKRKGK